MPTSCFPGGCVSSEALSPALQWGVCKEFKPAASRGGLRRLRFSSLSYRHAGTLVGEKHPVRFSHKGVQRPQLDKARPAEERFTVLRRTLSRKRAENCHSRTNITTRGTVIHTPRTDIHRVSHVTERTDTMLSRSSSSPASPPLLLLLLLAAFSSLVSSHTIITYPGSRGNNLKPGNASFPYDMQWQYPCA